MSRKKKELTPEQIEAIRTKDFFDCILPASIKFLSDHYIVGDSYRCVWAIREYPPATEEQAILSQLADRNGVTLRIYHRLVEPMEQRKIIQNATRRHMMKRGDNDMNDAIEADTDLLDKICDHLSTSGEVLCDLQVYDEQFDLTFYTDYKSRFFALEKITIKFYLYIKSLNFLWFFIKSMLQFRTYTRLL